MSVNIVFENMALLGAFGFFLLGLFILICAVSVWKERGMEAARWIIIADVLAFSISALFWLFWFFC